MSKQNSITKQEALARLIASTAPKDRAELLALVRLGGSK